MIFIHTKISSFSFSNIKNNNNSKIMNILYNSVNNSNSIVSSFPGWCPACYVSSKHHFQTYITGCKFSLPPSLYNIGWLIFFLSVTHIFENVTKENFTFFLTWQSHQLLSFKISFISFPSQPLLFQNSWRMCRNHQGPRETFTKYCSN